MRISSRAIIFGVAALAGMTAAFGQDRFANVQIKTHHIAGNIYMLEGRGGNIGVSAGPDGILIVDDQFAPLADKIRAALAEIGDGKLVFVLNTHFHGDHTGGNPEFGREAHIIAHRNVRKRLSTPQEVLGRTSEPLPKEGLPVITFEESTSIHFNGEEIRMIHMSSSHTDGDAIVFFTKSNVVHMGDTFFSGRFPFVDLGSGGDVAGLITTIRKVLEQVPADAKIIPGHGSLSTRADLKAYHQMLVATTDHVREQMKAGKTLDDIQAAGLPSKWDSWGTGFIKTDRWIGIVYNSFSKKGGEQ